MHFVQWDEATSIGQALMDARCVTYFSRRRSRFLRSARTMVTCFSCSLVMVEVIFGAPSSRLACVLVLVNLLNAPQYGRSLLGELQPGLAVFEEEDA